VPEPDPKNDPPKGSEPDPNNEPETFDREYVERLRAENADARTSARPLRKPATPR
jgi:hypothetical protein